MNTPTSSAPHICLNVLRNIWPSWERLVRRSRAIRIHDARMAVPPTNGVNVKVAATGFAPLSDDSAVTLLAKMAIFGSGDHGPVHRTTTMTSTTNGIQACQTSAAVGARSAVVHRCAVSQNFLRFPKL